MQEAVLGVAVAFALLFAVLTTWRHHARRDVDSPAESLFSQRPLPDVDAALPPAVASLATQGHLTAREAEVLEMLARGRNADVVARDLGISLSTARTHVKRIYPKLGVHSHQELIDLVERAGACER